MSAYADTPTPLCDVVHLCVNAVFGVGSILSAAIECRGNIVPYNNINAI